MFVELRGEVASVPEGDFGDAVELFDEGEEMALGFVDLLGLVRQGGEIHFLGGLGGVEIADCLFDEKGNGFASEVGFELLVERGVVECPYALLLCTSEPVHRQQRLVFLRQVLVSTEPSRFTVSARAANRI
jgi:hypothetical protein